MANSVPLASAERRFIRAAMSTPLLEADREVALAKAWRDEGSEPALHELTSAYMRLVIAMSMRFKGYGLPLEDLVQEGNIGLMQAAARFDPAREVRFSTYAAWWIRSAIQDFVLRNWSIVRIGTTSAHKSLFFNLRRLRALIDGDDLTPEARANIAVKLSVSEQDVAHMAARMAGSDRSLNALVSAQAEAEWQDLLADEADTPDALAEHALDAERRARLVAEALASLRPRERLVVEARKLSEEPMTLEAIGEQLNLSKERVRQIEAHALAKLRVFLEEKGARGNFL